MSVGKTLLGAFLMLSFSSCNGFTSDGLKDFIPGTYVRTIDHEFARGSDTLVITHLNGNAYQVVKRSRFVRIRNGKRQPFEKQTDTWTAVYDKEEQLLRASITGKRLIPLPRENKLLVEASLYEKIKN